MKKILLETETILIEEETIEIKIFQAVNDDGDIFYTSELVMTNYDLVIIDDLTLKQLKKKLVSTIPVMVHCRNSFDRLLRN